MMKEPGIFNISFGHNTDLIQALGLIGPSFDDQSFSVRYGIACMIVAPLMNGSIGNINCDPETGRADVKELDDRLAHALAGTEFTAKISQTGNCHLVVSITPERWGLYTHDCDRCVPLGSCTIRQQIFDLYFCSKSISTVIARYGSEGSEYISGFGMPVAPIIEAERRARGRGLI